MGAHPRPPPKIKSGIMGLIPVDMNHAAPVKRNAMKRLANQPVNAEFLQNAIVLEIDPDESLGMHANPRLVPVGIDGAQGAKL